MKIAGRIEHYFSNEPTIYCYTVFVLVPFNDEKRTKIKETKQIKLKYHSKIYGRVLGPSNLFFNFLHFELLSRNFELVTRNFDLVTRTFDLLSRNFDLLSHNFDLITRNFDLLSRNFDLLSRNFDLLS